MPTSSRKSTLNPFDAFTPPEPSPAPLPVPLPVPSPVPVPSASQATDAHTHTPALTCTSPLRDYLTPPDFDSLLSIASASDAIPREDLLQPDWPDRLLKAVLGKKAGDASMLPRACVALKYLVVLATGERNKDALKHCGLTRYGQISEWRNRSKPYNALIHEATTRQMTHLAVPVIDSVADAAIEGDVVRKFDAEGHLKTEQRRANVRAQELFLKAADPQRFGERAAPSAAPGGITYNIGAINLVAAGAPASMPLPASPAPVLESGEKRANTIDLKPANHPQLVAPQDFTTDD